MNHYELLGVERTASFEVIKAAYRKKMSECHPDRVADQDKKEASELASRYTEAYRILKKDRDAYDCALDIEEHCLNSEEDELIAAIHQTLFNNWWNLTVSENYKLKNYFPSLEKLITQQRNQIKDEINDLQLMLLKTKALLSTIKKTPFIAYRVNEQIKNTEMTIRTHEEALERVTTAIEILQSVVFTAPEVDGFLGDKPTSEGVKLTVARNPVTGKLEVKDAFSQFGGPSIFGDGNGNWP